MLRRATFPAVVLLLAAALGGCGSSTPKNASTYRPSLTRAPVPAEPAAAVPEEGPLTLQECLRLASANNRRISMADRRVLLQKDAKLEAIGSVMPRLTGSVRASGRSNELLIQRGEDTFSSGSQSSINGGLSLLVPLYDFGPSVNTVRAANASINSARLDAERVRQDLQLLVTQAYFRILESDKIYGVVLESLQAVQEQLHIAQDLFQQGIVAKSDVLVAEVQLARRKEDLLRAQKNIDLATSSLNRLLGLPVGRRTEVTDVNEIRTLPSSMDQLVTVALEKRPDLASLDRQVALARYRYLALRSSFMPKLAAFSNWNATSDETLVNKSWFEAGLGLQITLFDVGLFARIRAQNRLVDDAREQLEERADDVVLEVQQSYLTVREAGERLPVALKNIDQAEENLRVTRDRYREGLVTSADVLTEEERLAQARSDYYQSLYDYHQAYADLVHTLGTDPPATTAAAVTEPAPAAAPEGSQP